MSEEYARAFPEHEKTVQQREPSNKPYPMAAREMTVGEQIDKQIRDLEVKIAYLRGLRDSLPKTYLDRPCSGLTVGL